MSRFSSSSTSSLRQSLGMPVRASFAPDELRPLAHSRKSKLPTGQSLGVHDLTQRRQTSTGSRRQTQVLSGSSRPSTGRCVTLYNFKEWCSLIAGMILFSTKILKAPRNVLLIDNLILITYLSCQRFNYALQSSSENLYTPLQISGSSSLRYFQTFHREVRV